LLMDLSLNLKAIIAQQLLPTPDGKARVPAVEVLINTPLAADIIRKGEVHKLKELMKQSTQQGMRTFDQALYELYKNELVTYDDALRAADSANELRLMIKLGDENAAERIKEEATTFSLEEDEDEHGGGLFRRPPSSLR
jgi:twitching motility protein PilU